MSEVLAIADGRRERGAASRSRILDAAAAVIVDAGVGGLTHRAVDAAAGLPAVAPDLPPVRAVVEDGETGLLFPPGDAGALAGLLQRLLHDVRLCRRLGLTARRRVATDGGWDDRGRALGGLGERLLARGVTC